MIGMAIRVGKKRREGRKEGRGKKKERKEGGECESNVGRRKKEK